MFPQSPSCCRSSSEPSSSDCLWTDKNDRRVWLPYRTQIHQLKLENGQSEALSTSHQSTKQRLQVPPSFAFRLCFPTAFRIAHFIVVCLVTWPLNRSEAGVDLVLIQTLLMQRSYHEKNMIRVKKAGTR